MTTGLWHLSFTVADLERSLAFYQGLLGLELVHRQTQQNEYTARLVGFPDVHLEVAMLKVPGTEAGLSGHHLELVQYAYPAGEPICPATNQPGAPHLAFCTDDIHADVHRLRQAGVPFRSAEPVAIEAGRNKGGFTIYFQDPDGITLELVQPPKP
jgi:lactoylglutathione lyase